MFFASTAIVFSYHFSLEILTERHSMLFCIAGTEQCVFSFMSFFSSRLLRKPPNAAHDFEDVTAFVESGILLPFPKGAHAFISAIGLFSALQDSQFYYQ